MNSNKSSNWLLNLIVLLYVFSFFNGCGDETSFEAPEEEALLGAAESYIVSRETAWSFRYPTSGYRGGSYSNRDFLSPSNHIGEDSAHGHFTPVYAIANGVVKQVRRGNSQGYGSVVVIEHVLPSQELVQSIYGHLCNHTTTQITVNIGQLVTKGDLIGYIGDDAENGDGAEHLHLGIKLGAYDAYYCGYTSYNCPSSDFVDPTNFIQQRAGSLELTQSSISPLPLSSGSRGVLSVTVNNQFFYGGMFEFRARVQGVGLNQTSSIQSRWIDPRQSQSFQITLPTLYTGTYQVSTEFKAPGTETWWAISSSSSQNPQSLIVGGSSSSSGGSSSCHSGTNGGASYCSTSCPCAEGYGDCDSDAECLPGLICARDVGANYGVHSSMDFCEQPSGGTSSGGSSGGSASVSNACSATRSIPSSGGSVSGTTSGSSTLSGSCGGSSAPEQVFQWTPSTSGQWTLSTCGSGYDTLLYVSTSCGQASSELSCNDDGTSCANNGSRIQENFIAGQTYYIVVDGYSTRAGSFTLNVQRDQGTSSSGGSSSCHSGTNGGASYCSTSCPCAEGYGDCDSDAECLPGLICARDVGANYGVHSSMDFCERP